MEQAFIDAHKNFDVSMKGFRGGALVKTGDRSFCIIAEWDKFDSIVAARPAMISVLDRMRPLLEDLGGGLGATDPVSGTTVMELRPRPARSARRKAKTRTRTAGRAKKRRRKAR
jgi:hypothetical protein